MDQGKIKFIGNFNEFQKYKNISKNEFNEEIYLRNTRNKKNKKISNNNKIDDKNKKNNKNKDNKDKNNENEDNINTEKANDIISSSNKKLLDLTEKNNEILKKPKKEDLSLQTYFTYIKLQGGYKIFIILILCIIFARFFDSYRRIYITNFSKTVKEININNNFNNENLKTKKNEFNFLTYIKISFLGILLNFIVEFIITHSTIFSLRTLHEKMILKLLKAPINLFHDIVSIGQILNRLTKDVEIVQLIINRVTIFLKSFALLISCVYICFIYNKYSIIFSPILLFFSLLLTIYYLSAARNMEHLHRKTFSPILTIFNESIRGVELIRNFNNEENFKNKIYKKLDDHYGLHLYTEGCKRWYYQRLRYITHVFNIIMIMIIIYNRKLFSTQAIGLILQYTEELSWELATFLGFFSQIEISLIALERCEKVTKIIEEKDCEKFKEEEKENENNIKNNINNNINKWPNRGEIEFKNLYLKYRPGLPSVLKDINIHIKSKEKIGLVGRTGSGKSSLVLALSRIVEAHKGSIFIDDININEVNLDYLRHNICIIPQDIFLFEGTVKENIDPENKNNNDDIINILNEFGILKNINDNNEKLNFYIKEDGSNLSIGEKQLICFARVFLKNSKILILDEATSSLDSSTENIIKKKLNNYNATLIIIAHHIGMVKECEKIIVLDKGQIVEFDTYDNLLKNKNSKFYELYKESLIS
jgi:ABC-type multidrug transport system fused ATPase/permease subunit